MWKIGFVAALLAVAVACIEEEPCDRYVDYMCDCHASDPGFDCAELAAVFENADPELQDQCAIDLGAQQAEDQETGHVCAADTADTADTAVF